MQTSALVLAAFLVGCSRWNPPIASNDASGSISSGVADFDIVRYTNDARFEFGRPLLHTNMRLMEAARLHAEAMARFEYASYWLPGSRYPGIEERLDAVGYDYATATANIADDEPNARRAVDAWLSVPLDRGRMMDLAPTEMGAAWARSPNGEHYWVQIFARPRQTQSRPGQ